MADKPINSPLQQRNIRFFEIFLYLFEFRLILYGFIRSTNLPENNLIFIYRVGAGESSVIIIF